MRKVMPKKYHIKARPTPPRFTPPGKFGIVDWWEDCAGCRDCVKKRVCVYKAYDQEASFIHQMKDLIEYLYSCKACFRCVQDCTKGLLTVAINPQYGELGDSYWTPEVITCTWYQAETGKIPVSGAGYRGPFVGPGFDSMWTDMSEIVRPTRDGIHGREYISTAVDLGRKLPALRFEDGTLAGGVPPVITIPVPVIFNLLPFGDLSRSVGLTLAQAAAELGTLMTIRIEEYFESLSPYLHNLIPLLIPEDLGESGEILGQVRMAELPYTEGVMEQVEWVKGVNPGLVTSIRLPLTEGAPSQVEELAQAGAEVIHLCADYCGNEVGSPKPCFIKDLVRQVHLRLVEEGLRDEVTLIASGGIALAEHLAKVIICGADLVAIDLPLLIALECRLCKNCTMGLPCPVRIHEVEPEYGVPRVTNLIGAWHSQLIEVLGAMGMREVRRLRGETGRAMFFEEMEAETFGRLFGKRIKGIG